MKKTFKFCLGKTVFGIIALMLIIGFVMIGCDNPSGGGKDKDNDTPIENPSGGGGNNPLIPNLTGTLTVSPNPAKKGDTLTAVYSNPESVSVSYQWYKNGTAIAGKVSDTLVTEDSGTYKVTVSADGYNSKTSEDVTVTLGPLTSAIWTEILTNIDNYLTGDGVLDLSDYTLGGSSDPLDDVGVFDPEVDSALLTQAAKVKIFILPNAATAIAADETYSDPTFEAFTGLAVVNGSGIVTIGVYAFGECESLTSANFPAAISIDEYAFYDCRSLTSVNFPAQEISSKEPSMIVGVLSAQNFHQQKLSATMPLASVEVLQVQTSRQQ